MNNFYLTNNESFVLFFLIIALVFPFNLINNKFKLTIAHPLIIYSSFMLYYTVFCPVVQIAYNQTSNKGFDFREVYILGWAGALVSLISLFIFCCVFSNFVTFLRSRYD